MWPGATEGSRRIRGPCSPSKRGLPHSELPSSPLLSTLTALPQAPNPDNARDVGQQHPPRGQEQGAPMAPTAAQGRQRHSGLQEPGEPHGCPPVPPRGLGGVSSA